VLAAAIGNCLSASLVFCLKKANVAPSGVTADVDVEIVRNESRLLRVGKVNVTLHTELQNERDEEPAGLSLTFGRMHVGVERAA
jgi:hypothetical protein